MQPLTRQTEVIRSYEKRTQAAVKTAPQLSLFSIPPQFNLSLPKTADLQSRIGRSHHATVKVNVDRWVGKIFCSPKDVLCRGADEFWRTVRQMKVLAARCRRSLSTCSMLNNHQESYLSLVSVLPTERILYHHTCDFCDGLGTQTWCHKGGGDERLHHLGARTCLEDFDVGGKTSSDCPDARKFSCVGCDGMGSVTDICSIVQR